MHLSVEYTSLNCASLGIRGSAKVTQGPKRVCAPGCLLQSGGSVYRATWDLGYFGGLFLYLFKTLSLSLFIEAYLAKPTDGLQ